MKNKIASQTRILYNNIHKKQLKNKESYKKLKTSSYNFFLKYKKFFFNKVACDLGCGNTGHAGKTLLSMGAKKVYFVDFNRSINKNLKTNLSKFKSKFEIINTDIQKKILKKNFFDFIICQGVIHHIQNDTKTFKNIFSNLKKGGYFIFDVQGEGGLITDFLNLIVRKKYKTDKNVKKLLDGFMNKKTVIFEKIFLRDFNHIEKKNLFKLKKLFDDDLFLTLKDRILSPQYKMYNEKKLIKKLKQIGFKNVKRVEKETKLNNIRKIFNYNYSNYNHSISKALFGEGNISIIAKK